MIDEKIWNFRFPYYVSKCSREHNGVMYSVIKKLDPISFWLIRMIHGERKLKEMAARTYLDNSLS